MNPLVIQEWAAELSHRRAEALEKLLDAAMLRAIQNDRAQEVRVFDHLLKQSSVYLVPRAGRA